MLSKDRKVCCCESFCACIEAPCVEPIEGLGTYWCEYSVYCSIHEALKPQKHSFSLRRGY